MTYPDGSKETIDVPVHVVDNRSDADKYTPNVEDETVDAEQVAEMAADRVSKVLNEMLKPAKKTAERAEATEKGEATETSAIDYSSFEERLAKLN